MNKNILTFLNEYAEIPDPQYAIMLRGAWGCGKTFFIRQWMEQLKSNRDADKLKWQPIYVSLYGLTTTQQITEQINKEISPWLYSKGMKLAKNVLKVASKIALKYDIDGDGKDEGSVTCDLDSILLLKEENSEIKGNKILIFDDLERCDVKLETLLGYINYFSEHCKCKVIIIGDENKISEKEDDKCKLKFKDFNETFKNRDLRLTETVMSSGYKFKSTITGSRPLNVQDVASDAKGINPPFLTSDGNAKNVTGYHIRLGVDTTYVQGDSEVGLVIMLSLIHISEPTRPY